MEILIQVLCIALNLYQIILFIRIILSFVTVFTSWTPPPGLSGAVRVIYDLTEPVLGFMRQFIPAIGGLDFSPLIIFFIIGLAQNALGCGGIF